MRRLLGRIAPIYNRSEEFDEAIWQASGQNNLLFRAGTAIPTGLDQAAGHFA